MTSHSAAIPKEIATTKMTPTARTRPSISRGPSSLRARSTSPRKSCQSAARVSGPARAVRTAAATIATHAMVIAAGLVIGNRGCRGVAPTGSAPPQPEELVERDAGGDSCVEGLHRAAHRHRHDLVAGLAHEPGESLALAADDHDERGVGQLQTGQLDVTVH